jgi:hypothetical protein
MKRNFAALALAAVALLPLLTLSAERSKVEFTLLRVDRTDPENPIGFFTFRQTTRHSLPVYGFEEPTNGRFHPRFVEYQFQTNGAWRSLPICYCGTGAQSYSLRSGHTYRLKVELFAFTNATDRVRVGIASTDPQVTHGSDSFRPIDHETR